MNANNNFTPFASNRVHSCSFAVIFQRKIFSVYFFLLCLFDIYLVLAVNTPLFSQNLAIADEGGVKTQNVSPQKDVAFLHSKAREQIEKNEPGLALSTLAEIPTELRTDETKILVMKAVLAIKELGEELGEDAWKIEKNWPFQQKPVETLLSETIAIAPELGFVLAELYSTRVITFAQEQKLDLASEYLSKIFLYRPDPNEENNALRLTLAVMLPFEHTKYFAQSRVTELESTGSLGPWARMRLLLSGYYGKKYPNILIGTVLFITILLMLSYWKPQFIVKRQQAPKKPLKKVKPGTPGYETMATSADEYSQLLHVLELADDATEEDIKHAYRGLVKKFHPDRVTAIHRLGDPNRLNSMERFREITEAYDRILEIRKGWFGK